MYFTFNDITSTSKGLMVNGIINPPPAIQKSTLQVGNKTYVGKKKFKAREIAITVSYIGSSVSDLYNKITDITNWLIDSVPHKLILSDDSSKYYICDAELDIKKQINNLFFEGEIVFTCLDNRIYAVADDSIVWNPDNYL